MWGSEDDRYNGLARMLKIVVCRSRWVNGRPTRKSTIKLAEDVGPAISTPYHRILLQELLELARDPASKLGARNIKPQNIENFNFVGLGSLLQRYCPKLRSLLIVLSRVVSPGETITEEESSHETVMDISDGESENNDIGGDVQDEGNENENLQDENDEDDDRGDFEVEEIIFVAPRIRHRRRPHNKIQITDSIVFKILFNHSQKIMPYRQYTAGGFSPSRRTRI